MVLYKKDILLNEFCEFCKENITINLIKLKTIRCAGSWLIY